MRSAVGVLDQTSFAKYSVSGPGAEAFLDRLCANRLPALGRIALTQMCRPGGGIECDLTVTRVEPERFYLVSAAATELHDYAWLECAPSRRRLGASCENVHRALRRAHARRAAVARAPPVARRGGRVARGVPVLPRAAPGGGRRADADAASLVRRRARVRAAPSAAEHLANALRPAARGRRAARARRLRLPRARLAAAREGLPALGRRHVRRLDAARGRAGALRRLRQGRVRRARRAAAPARGGRRAHPRLPDRRDGRRRPARLRAGRANGTPIGYVAAGGYGHVVEQSIALAYLPVAHAEPGTRLEVEILGEPRPRSWSSQPIYDPAERLFLTGLRIAIEPVRLTSEPVRWDLVPGHTALVVIDHQRDFLHPDGWYARSGIDISHMRTGDRADAAAPGRLPGRAAFRSSGRATAPAASRTAARSCSCARSCATAACAEAPGATRSTMTSRPAPTTGRREEPALGAFFNTNLELVLRGVDAETVADRRRADEPVRRRDLEGRDVPRLQADRRRGVHRHDAAASPRAGARDDPGRVGRGSLARGDPRRPGAGCA